MTGTRSQARWQVYILRCRDGTLYTGVTTDLARRVTEHNGGARGARYTRGRRPVELVYSESAKDRGAALRREHRLRRLSGSTKRRLLEPRAAGVVEPISIHGDRTSLGRPRESAT